MNKTIKGLILSVFFIALFYGFSPHAKRLISPDDSLSLSHTSAYSFLTTANIDSLAIEYQNDVNSSFYQNLIFDYLEKSKFSELLEVVKNQNLVLISKSPLYNSSVDLDTYLVKWLSVRQFYFHEQAFNGIEVLEGFVTFNEDGKMAPKGSPSLTVDLFSGARWHTIVSNVSTTATNTDHGIRWMAHYFLSATLWRHNVIWYRHDFGQFSINQKISY